MGLYPGALSSDELVMSDYQNVKDLDKPTSYEPQPPSPTSPPKFSVETKNVRGSSCLGQLERGSNSTRGKARG